MRLLLLSWAIACMSMRATAEEGNGDDVPVQNYFGNLSNPNSKVFLYSGMEDVSFFQLALDGCRKQAKMLSLKSKSSYECLSVMPEVGKATEQAEILKAHLPDPDENHNIVGVMVSAYAVKPLSPVIDSFIDRGIPVVAFDSDAPGSKRLKYIGTDQQFFGATIAKALIQLHPEGGTFSAVFMGHIPNLQRRYEGFMGALEENAPGLWQEVQGTPISFNRDDPDFLVKRLYDVADGYSPTAIAPLQGYPQRLGEPWVNFTELHQGITIVAGDAFDVQLEQLRVDSADGLVGQLPFEMGLLAARFLTRYNSGKLTAKDENPTLPLGTNLLTHIRVPIELPYLEVDENHLKSLKFIGFAAFGFVAILSLMCMGWAIAQRSAPIVKMAQPLFLIMVALGVLVWSSSVIPVSFDDEYGELSDFESIAVCMASPWLFFVGFTITFSALFAKIHRVNKLFHSNQPFQRFVVSHREVLIPFLLLITCNLVVLAAWTIFHPMKYVRRNHSGTDGWNRVISTYGRCESNGSWPYAAVLAVMNLGLLLLSNWEAYEARRLEQEIAESKYIGLIMGSMVQAALVGGPLLSLVDDNPEAYYLVYVLLNFILSLVTLLLMFVPKILQSRKGTQEQMDRVHDVIRMAAVTSAERRTKSQSRSSSNSDHTPLPSQINSVRNSFRNFTLSSVSSNASVTKESNGENDPKESAKPVNKKLSSWADPPSLGLTANNRLSSRADPPSPGLMENMASSPVRSKGTVSITDSTFPSVNSWAETNLNLSTFERGGCRSSCEVINEGDSSDDSDQDD